MTVIPDNVLMGRPVLGAAPGLINEEAEKRFLYEQICYAAGQPPNPVAWPTVSGVTPQAGLALLESSIQVLAKQVDILSQKLGPVLLPYAQESSEIEKSTDVDCPATKLREMERLVTEVSRLLTNLMARLDL